MKHRALSSWWLLLTVVIFALAVPLAAWADDISNNLDVSVDAVAEVMPLNAGGTNGTTTLYLITQNGDGKNGCNLTGSTSLSLSVSSSNTGVATVSPSSVTFTSCSATATLIVTPVSQGSTTISVAQTSNNTGGTFNLAPATFTVNVAPPANTAPTVSVAGVTGGASYERGSVPAATCQVTDTEDGNSSFAATLSEVSGPLAAYGLGAQTASCSYNDLGGLTASASETYSIVDTTAPVIEAHGNETAEATSGAGAVVNYTAPAWSDAVSGTGAATCTPASGTIFPLGSTTVNCNTTDAAGNMASSSFNVTVVDTTAPSLSLPSGGSVEATGPSGAAVNYAASASDLVDGAVAVSCTPASGSTFALGTTSVNCNATDAAGNTASGSFNVTVVDTTAPSLSLPGDQTAEATGPGGAAVSFSASATDLVDGAVAVSCTPASGSTFALGTTSVNCNTTDAAGNTASSSFNVTVVDTTAPSLNLPSGGSVEATGPSGAAVNYTVSASDLVDGAVAVNCTPASGSTFPLGTTSVNCNATDASGNTASGSFNVTVVDTTPPVVTVPADILVEATGPGGAAVTFSASANDSVSGAVAVSCTPASGSTFALGTTSVNCSATDAASNTGSASFSVTVVDTTPPSVSLIGGPASGASYYFGSVPAAPTCSASDSGSGINGSCSVSGYSTAVGNHTVTATATDNAGNVGSASSTYTVLAWTLNGFYQPVDMSTSTTTVWNTVKGGSTVPLKFEVFAGATELTSTSVIVQPLKALVTTCAGNTIDDIELTATGGTALRYDTTGGQFIYNWQTPKTAGACYKVTVSTTDGSSISASFKTK